MRKQVLPYGIEWEAGSGRTGSRPSKQGRRTAYLAACCGVVGLVTGFGVGRAAEPAEPAALVQPAAVVQPAAAAATDAPAAGVPWTVGDLPTSPDAAERWIDSARGEVSPADLPRTPDAIEQWLEQP